MMAPSRVVALCDGALIAIACVFLVLVARVLAARASLAKTRVDVVVSWRPRLLWRRLYQKSERSLLKRVESRFAKARATHGGKGRRAFGAVLGTRAFVHVGEAKLARAALKGTSVKSPLYHAFEAFAGTGIFTAEGGDWEEKRSEVLRAFHRVGIGRLRDAAVRESGKTVESLTRAMTDEQTAAKEATKKARRRGNSSSEERRGCGCEIRALPVLQRLALRITFSYLTGRTMEEACEACGSSRDEIEDEYLAAATTLRHLIPARARSIWILSDFLYGLTPIGRLEAREIATTKRMSALALRVALEDSPIGILKRGKAHSREKHVRVEDESYPKGLLDEVTTLLFAGHDTQSATLSWGLLKLIQHPDVQRDLRASLEDKVISEALGLRSSVVSSKRSTRGGDSARKESEKSNPAWATSAFAPMLESVIRETMRLHPVAPLVVRRLTSDVQYGNGAVLPKGCAVGVWLSSVHRDTEIWDRPEEFDPSRWIGPSHARTGSTGSLSEEAISDEAPSSSPASSALKRRGVGYMPFAYGPRACVGQHLAQVTMRVALAHLVDAFEFAPSEVDEDAACPSVGFTVTPATGAPMKIYPANSNRRQR